MPPAISLFLCSFLAVLPAAAFLLTMRRGERTRRILECLPRERISGSILAAAALVWCVPNIRPIFAPDSPFQPWIIPLMAVSLVLVILFLNYLFARAFAAILILGANALLKQVYPINPPGCVLLAVLVLTAGVIGIVISAKPYWLRDWIRLSFRKPSVRWCSAVYFLILSGMSCFCALEV